ncbi:MAG: hypothetical protein MJE68_16490 [Proteobacteria bacterium]|nr:hypothetical protein [Pseudomonadota bacterium]
MLSETVLILKLRITINQLLLVDRDAWGEGRGWEILFYLIDASDEIKFNTDTDTTADKGGWIPRYKHVD